MGFGLKSFTRALTGGLPGLGGGGSGWWRKGPASTFQNLAGNAGQTMQRGLGSLTNPETLTNPVQGFKNSWNEMKQTNKDIWNQSREANQGFLRDFEQTGRGAYHNVAQATPGDVGLRMRQAEEKGGKFRQGMRDDWFNYAWNNLKANVRGDPLIREGIRKPTDTVNEKWLGLDKEERLKLGGTASTLGGTIGGYFGQGWIGPAIAGVHGIQENVDARTAATNAITGAIAGYSGGAGRATGSGAGSAAGSMIGRLAGQAAAGAAVGGGAAAIQGGNRNDILSGAAMGGVRGATGGWGGVASQAISAGISEAVRRNPQLGPYAGYASALYSAYGGNYNRAVGQAIQAYARQTQDPKIAAIATLYNLGANTYGAATGDNMNQQITSGTRAAGNLASLYNYYQNSRRS